MEKNNKILLMAVLVLLLALVSFNFDRGDLSGRAVDSGSARVYPTTQTCDKYEGSKQFTLTLNPNTKLDNKANVVDVETGYRAGTESLSSSSYIDTPLTHKFLASCGRKGIFRLEFEDAQGGNVVLRSNSYSIN